jgi:uncharacterized protein (TIGR03435 family)
MLVKMTIRRSTREMRACCKRALCAALFLACATAWGQGLGPSFEVASVKANDPNAPAQPLSARGRGMLGVGGRFDIQRVSLTYLITRAFDVEGSQIAGPGWMTQQNYDLAAKAPAGATAEQTATMFRNLLVERFKMKFHVEEPETPVYVLEVAPGGFKGKAAVKDDDPYTFGQISAGEGAAPGTVAARTPENGVYRLSSADGVTHYEYLNITLKGLANVVGLLARSSLGSTIVDATGLRGEYRVEIDVPTAQLHCTAGGAQLAAQSLSDQASVAADPCGGWVRPALEKMGLRLVRKSIPLKKIVIESIEKTPTEN